MLEDLVKITTSPWGEVKLFNDTICVYVISSKGMTNDDFSQLLIYRKELQKQFPLVIHLWDDVWKSKKELIVNRLTAMKGNCTQIHARKCTIINISQVELDGFLNLHHVQGSVKSRVKYGLMYENELVGVASFSARRAMTYNGKKDYYSAELIRFCSKAGMRIYGGLDKLLKHYERNFDVNDIMTYADKDWSNGASYLTLGFKISNETNPLAFSLDENMVRKLVANPTEKALYLWNSGNIKLHRNVEK